MKLEGWIVNVLLEKFYYVRHGLSWLNLLMHQLLRPVILLVEWEDPKEEQQRRRTKRVFQS